LRENPRHRQCANRTSIRPSYILWITRIEPLGHCHNKEKFQQWSTDTSSSNSNKDYKLNKPQRQYINQLAQAAVKKAIGESNVIESDEDEEWSKGLSGMTSSEHIYVLSAAQADQATDSTEFEIKENDLADFRRRFKKQQGKRFENNSMANEMVERHMMMTSGEVKENS
jgi:hypothetical protein